MDERGPFFSIIMPVFNGEKTMHKSIGSILTQTFSDYELIIVENGSVDSSLDIAKAYAAVYPNVHALHSEPRGVSRARNVGLDKSKGEYIVFLDADDHYVSTALEAMHDALCRVDADILIAGMTNYPMIADGSLVSVDPKRLYLTLLDPVPNRNALFEAANARRGEFAPRHQCSRAYKRKFLEREGIRFDESCPIYVDLLFNKQAYSACKKPYLLYRKLYQYNHNDNSLVRRKGEAFILDAKPAFFILAAQIDALSGEERSAVTYAAFSILFSMFRACAKAYSDKEFDMLRELNDNALTKAVISEIRSKNLHLDTSQDEQRKKLLLKLRENDIRAALDIFDYTKE